MEKINLEMLDFTYFVYFSVLFVFSLPGNRYCSFNTNFDDKNVNTSISSSKENS